MGRVSKWVRVSGVDVNSEEPERSRKNFEMFFFVDFRKISIQSVPADLTISRPTGTRVPAKYQVPERRSGSSRPPSRRISRRPGKNAA